MQTEYVVDLQEEVQITLTKLEVITLSMMAASALSELAKDMDYTKEEEETLADLVADYMKSKVATIAISTDDKKANKKMAKKLMERMVALCTSFSNPIKQ